MKKTISSFVLIFTILISAILLTQVHASSADVWDGSADTSWYSKYNNRFYISTAEQLAGLAKCVNDGDSMENKTIYLTNDIILNENVLNSNKELNDGSFKEWTPIGLHKEPKNMSLYCENVFAGTFDGQGYTISGLYIRNNYDDYGNTNIGLFSRVGTNQPFNVYNPTVKNVRLTDSYIESSNADNTTHSIGGIVGSLDGNCTITNCSFDGNIITAGSGGGIVGKSVASDNGLNLSNCINSGILTNSLGDNTNLGGIIGNCIASNEISCCISTVDSLPLVGSDTNKITAVNSYYLSSEDSDNTKTAKEFASGSVCYLLNSTIGEKNSIFGQNIGTDMFPHFINTDLSDKVYTVNFKYEDKTIPFYYNEGATIPSMFEDFPNLVFNWHKMTNFFDNPTTTLSSSLDNNTLYGNVQSIHTQLNGNGTKSSPFIIATESDWAYFSRIVSSEFPVSDDTFNIICSSPQTAYYLQTTDINITSPISVGTEKNPFAGNYDGGGHSLTLDWAVNDTEYAPAIFGYTTGGAVISNLSTAGTITTTQKFSGGIVSQISNGEVTLNKCSSSIAFNFTPGGDATCGGLVGVINNGGSVTINTSFFIGSFNGGNDLKGIGGMCGWTNGTVTINDSYVYADFPTGITDSNIMSRRNTASVNTNNCYYALKNSNIPTADSNETLVNVDQVAGGELCYLLGSLYAQTLGVDEYPTHASNDLSRNVYVLTLVYTDSNTLPDEVVYYNPGYTLPVYNTNYSEFPIYWYATADLTGDRITTADAGSNNHIYYGISTFSLKGEGTKDSPFLISSLNELSLLCRNIKNNEPMISATSGNICETPASAYYLQTEDFLIKTAGYYIGTESNPFTGHYDGGGHNIHYDMRFTKLGQGLFAYVADNAHITNLSVSGYMQLNKYNGSIVGTVLSGNVTIDNCFNSGTINVTSSIGAYMGGLAGHINRNAVLNINNCGFSGSIDGSNLTDYLGSFCGSNQGTVNISDSYASINVRCSILNIFCYNLKGGVTNVSNSYYRYSGTYDNVVVNNGAVSKTMEQFKSGEVCALLGDGFGQALGSDKLPLLNNKNKVYSVEFILNNEVISTQYVNSGNTVTLPDVSDIENASFSANGIDFTADSVITSNTKVLITFPFCLGDVNGDGLVNVYDSTQIAKFSIGQITFTTQQLTSADINDDGSVDLYDASLIAKQAIGA